MTAAPGTGDDVLAAALARLDDHQRALLTAGESGWHTLPAPDAGLSRLLMGDGPMGLVSPTFDERYTALLLPCGTALGATWDPEVVASVARAQGSEALRREWAVVYSPNMNLARTGLSGRTYEMFGEDPELSGVLGAAFVRGMQGQGVGACVKHLAANDTETERQRMSATVDEVTLREVYLRPFEIALMEGGAWAVIVAYNRLNGLPCTANPHLLSIVKDDWGWDGVLISDYFALKDTVAPVLAGIDLEMPGPAIHLGPKVAAAVRAGQVPQSRVDDAVTRLLRLAGRTGSLEGSTRQVSAPEEHVSAEDAPGVLAAAAAASFVLLKNEGEILPLDPSGAGTVAVLGPNAALPTYQGAAFGRVRPEGAPTTPLDAVRARFGEACEVVHEPGVLRSRPETLGSFDVRTPDGEPGVLLEHFRGADPEPVLTETRTDTAFIWFGLVPGAGPTGEPSRLRLTAVLTPDATGPHLVGGGGSGATTVSVDGDVVAERPAPTPDDIMGQVARAEMTTGEVQLTAGVPVRIVVDMDSAGARVQALTVGCLRPQAEGALERAVAAAAGADAVVLVVGDALETSRESQDLTTSGLPTDQVELVRQVSAANPRTVVIVNAGRPVDAPWADDAAAVLHVWFPGQEFGPALAGVLAGDAEPSGRMPVTVPVRDEDRSTWGSHLDDDLALDYTSTEPTGYRHLMRTGTAPRFAFGSGLGYTTWSHGAPRVDVAGEGSGRTVRVTAPVTNTGERSGREVVQVYVRGPGETDARLGGFAGVRLAPGESGEVVVEIPARAFARWDTAASAWHTPPGEHAVLVGRSSVELPHRVAVAL